MNKLMVCLALSLMATHFLNAQDSARVVYEKIVTDTIKKSVDTSFHVTDTLPKSLDTVNHQIDTAAKVPVTSATDTTKKDLNNSVAPLVSHDSSAQVADTSKPKSNDIKMTVDKTDPTEVGTRKDWDKRWFISPLFKLQLQDFGLMEKSHYGSLSNANQLSLLDKSNVSAALSIYKNLSGHVSASADFGLSYGHVTSPQVLVGTTTPKTFNLINATLYYHLLGPQHKLQPYVAVGINDLINDASYLTAPMGVGLKYHTHKIILTAQASYGYAVSKNMANTTVYNIGLYVPIALKKKKEKENTSESKVTTKDTAATKKLDTAAKKTDSLANKINADSALNASMNESLNGNKTGKSDSADSFSDENNPDGTNGANGSNSGGGKGLKAFNYQDFSKEDFRVDTVDGRALVKFVIYFEFNQYDLNSSAFNRVDKVIERIRKDKSLVISIKGYTDNVGSNEFNIYLSKKRAQMVADYMNSRGVPSDRMTVRYYGKENPVADNNNPNTAWLNRRAELIIREKDAKEVPDVKIPMPRNLRK